MGRGLKMLKQLILILVVLMSANLVLAGEIVKQNDATVFIYGAVEDTIRMKMLPVGLNYNKTVCINATVIEGEIRISGSEPYSLEYNFIADINDSHYISRIITIDQEIVSSSWLTGIVMNRTLTIDAVEISSYQTTHAWFGGKKDNTMYWCLMDDAVRFGDEVYENTSLAFTQLNYQDQQDYINDSSIIAGIKINHKYISVGVHDEGVKLTGLTGWAYNALGQIPWGFGESVQGLIFMPLMIIQYTINFLFSFLFMIINNWWYSLLLLEIFCIIPALTHKDYPSVVGTFIDMHVKIFYFMYHKVILPLIAQLLRLIEVIRNLFRI